MTVEIRRDPGAWGDLKKFGSSKFPAAYRVARQVKEELRDGLRFPHVFHKSLDGITFEMMVRSRQEWYVVEGACFEEEMLLRMLEAARPGDIVFDIGAATGTHTIPCAMKVGSWGRVYSFEPDRECAGGLAENLSLNGIANTQVCQLALWDRDTTIAIYSEGRKGEAPQTCGPGERPTKKTLKKCLRVSARRIESLVSQGVTESPDIVKIDVEGAGKRVIGGLGRIRPRDIFMEIHPKMGEKPAEITNLLNEMGYAAVWKMERAEEEHWHFAQQN